MARIPYVDSDGYVTATVNLKNATNVFLVDSHNFNNYKSGRRFQYYGGYYNKTPVRISVKGHNRWYLIVENSDYSYSFD